MKEKVFIEKCADYSLDRIGRTLDLFDDLFASNIKSGETILLKPNWIAPHHKYNPYEWESVITHPNFVTGIITKVLKCLNRSGKIIIADAPQTDTQFEEIAERYPFDEWMNLCNDQHVDIEIVDLRSDEWVSNGGVVISRKKLPGDPLGSVEYNLRELSEFKDHSPSRRGYYGADCNINETTQAHTNGNHIYRISKSVISADVFINLPKWKTHKKAGITCSLKNLVGINTFKNFLPHHNEGTPSMGGDQFPDSDVKSFSEAYLLKYFKNLLVKYDKAAPYMVPVKKLGKIIFGDTRNTIRTGNWYGNNTLWRTILDLNKLLLYGNTNNTIRSSNISQQKKYLSFVDGIIAGDGNGPEAPNPTNTQLIIGGSNPVSVDCVAAKLMGFDYLKVPSIANAFKIAQLPLVDFSYSDIVLFSKTIKYYNDALFNISRDKCFHFEPHFGWTGHIELESEK